MSEKDFIDFSFRYRPRVDSPDGILMRYLLSYKPIERRNMILKALRAFYLVAAYGSEGDFERVEQLGEFVRTLEKVYGEGAMGANRDDLTLEIDIRISYMGSHELPGSDSDEDD